jgi:hypothetical protein
MLSWEGPGPIGYAEAHPDIAKRIKGSINLDMIASVKEDKAHMHIIQNPVSSFSAIDVMIPAVYDAWDELKETDTKRVIVPYVIENTPLADPRYGVPMSMMLMHPALSYHSSMDDMSRIDKGVLACNSVVACVSTLLCAGLGKEANTAASEILKKKIDT